MDLEHSTGQTMALDSEIRKLEEELDLERKRGKIQRLQKQIEAEKERNEREKESDRQARAQHNLDLLNTKSLFRFLADRKAYAIVFGIIFDHLDIAGVIRLSRTCRSCSNIYNEFTSRKWNIDKCLSRFVTNPKDFRYNLGVNQALIIGDIPLQFFLSYCLRRIELGHISWGRRA